MNINATEVVVLIVFAVILFGPDKLPELARKAARILHYLRTIANQAQDTVRTELGPGYEDFDIRHPKQFVTDKILGEYGDVVDDIKESAQVVGASAAVARDDLAGVRDDLAESRTLATEAVTPAAGEPQSGPEAGVGADQVAATAVFTATPTPGEATAVVVADPPWLWAPAYDDAT